MGRSQGQHGAFGKDRETMTVSLKQARLETEKHSRFRQQVQARKKQEAAERQQRENQELLALRQKSNDELQTVLGLGAKTYKCDSDVAADVEKWEKEIFGLISAASYYMRQYQKQHGKRFVIQWNSDWQDTGMFRIGVAKQVVHS